MASSSSSSPSSASASATAAATATTRAMMMEKLPISQQDQQAPLKCPRCDSSNTKFCYYNNYSLSQPRHFCKACKRYWTRGGTLRNVPVGGGCRKNKRVKRPNPTSTPTSTSTSSVADVVNTTTSSLSHHYSGGGGCHIDLSQSPPPPHINPLFYSLLTNPSDLNLPYPIFNSRVSNIDSFDLQMNGSLGLGFSSSPSGLLVSDLQGGFPNNTLVKQNQNQSHNPNNSFLNSQSYPVFGSTPTSTSTTTMASLIASTLHQQKLINSFGGNNFLQGSNDDNNGEGCIGVNKDVKMEENINGGQNRFDWNNMVNANQNHIEQQMINSAGDSSLLWNPTSGVGVGAGAWLDPSNMGSSVPSLI